MTAQCLISFGSNLGNRDALIAEAARIVARSPLVKRMQASRLFATPPIGGPGDQQPFLNAVAAFETTATAREILELLQQTEHRLGRQRRQRWDARSIDLDVVLHGELVGGGTGLIVPHPRYTARQFVLQPACDVAAHYRDPRFGWTLRRLAQHLSEGVASLALVGGDVATRNELCRRLSDQYDIQTFAAKPVSAPMPVVGNAPAAIRADRREPDRSRSGLDDDWHAGKHEEAIQTAVEGCDQPWVSAFAPPLPALDSGATSNNHVPRLIARMQWATPETRWPAPHQMWPAGWRWPEYRLEVDDVGWAVCEIASALASMRCPATPVTDDGNWAK